MTKLDNSAIVPSITMTEKTTDQFLWSDPQRLGGRVCFRGTRVPVDALFENLEDGVSVDDFITAFEGVSRDQVVGVLEAARHALAEVALA